MPRRRPSSDKRCITQPKLVPRAVWRAKPSNASTLNWWATYDKCGKHYIIMWVVKPSYLNYNIYEVLQCLIQAISWSNAMFFRKRFCNDGRLFFLQGRCWRTYWTYSVRWTRKPAGHYSACNVVDSKRIKTGFHPISFTFMHLRFVTVQL